MNRLLLLVPLLVGCPTADDTDTSGDTSDDTGWPCAENEGLVAGTALVDGSVNPGVIVEAYAMNGGGDSVVATPDATDGAYTMCLPQGEWSVWATLNDCTSGDYLDVLAGETYPLDLDVNTTTDCDTADKPNLYLYPSAPTRTSVTLGLTPQQRVFASEPRYRHGWRGVALPDGRFVTADGPAPFLFYEVTLLASQTARFQRDAGWCLDGDVPTAVVGMAGLLERYGFNAAEVDDFVEGWRLDLPQAGAYVVYPQQDVDHAAELYITPALRVDRLWLLVDKAEACGEALVTPAVVPFDRTGPHGVEWGVVLHGFDR